MIFSVNSVVIVLVEYILGIESKFVDKMIV